MPYPQQPGRPMPLGGMMRGMQAQGGGAPPQGAAPGAVPTVQRQMPQNPWLQQGAGGPGGWGAQNAMALKAMGRGLGAQSQPNWGDNGDAPTIQNPSAGGGPLKAAMLQQAAARFAQQQRPQMQAEDEDPRMRGMAGGGGGYQ